MPHVTRSPRAHKGRVKSRVARPAVHWSHARIVPAALSVFAAVMQRKAPRLLSLSRPALSDERAAGVIFVAAAFCRRWQKFAEEAKSNYATRANEPLVRALFWCFLLPAEASHYRQHSGVVRHHCGRPRGKVDVPTIVSELCGLQRHLHISGVVAREVPSLASHPFSPVALHEDYHLLQIFSLSICPAERETGEKKRHPRGIKNRAGCRLASRPLASTGRDCLLLPELVSRLRFCLFVLAMSARPRPGLLSDDGACSDFQVRLGPLAAPLR